MKKRILYLSALSSQRLIDGLYQQNKVDPGFAVQKFNRLLVSGLIENLVEVTVLSAPPVGRHNSSKVLWHRLRETEKEITYSYLNFINFSGLRQICLVVEAFFKTLFWSIGKKKTESAVVCDVLNASICVAAIMACKITGIQSLGVMTDMPGLMVRFEREQRLPWRTRIATGIIKWCLNNFKKYVFLTEAMNVVNERKRPYIVMEGMSDRFMATYKRPFEAKDIQVVMYAGGLHERYGLKKLTEAFMMLPQENFRLKLFGSGPFVEKLKTKYTKKDSRIQYMGVAPNAEVVAAELDASLLVNPRPTHEEFTKYSFPSKNIEYMASGTPLLTTKLPGMPKEYYPYVFLIENESVEGYAKALERVLAQSDEELYVFGEKAKDFVLEKKNSFEQAKRVIELIKL